MTNVLNLQLNCKKHTLNFTHLILHVISLSSSPLQVPPQKQFQFLIRICVFHTLHFQCNSLNISWCKQMSTVLPLRLLLASNYTENLQWKSPRRNFHEQFPQFMPVVHKKRIGEFEKSQTKTVICMLKASWMFLQLFELLRHALGTSNV